MDGGSTRARLERGGRVCLGIVAVVSPSMLPASASFRTDSGTVRLLLPDLGAGALVTKLLLRHSRDEAPLHASAGRAGLS